MARVSRFDRQLRYYRVRFRLASVLSGYPKAWIYRERHRKNFKCTDPLMCKTPLRMEQRFGPALATGLPSTLAGGFPPHLLQVIRPVVPFVGSAHLAVALAGACCSWLTDLRQPVHHWHPSNSNWRAVSISVYFHSLKRSRDRRNFEFWKAGIENNSKNHSVSI